MAPVTAYHPQCMRRTATARNDLLGIRLLQLHVPAVSSQRSIPRRQDVTSMLRTMESCCLASHMYVEVRSLDIIPDSVAPSVTNHRQKSMLAAAAGLPVKERLSLRARISFPRCSTSWAVRKSSTRYTLGLLCICLLTLPRTLTSASPKKMLCVREGSGGSGVRRLDLI